MTSDIKQKCEEVRKYGQTILNIELTKLLKKFSISFMYILKVYVQLKF